MYMVIEMLQKSSLEKSAKPGKGGRKISNFTVPQLASEEAILILVHAAFPK